jgi:integrase
MRIPVQYAVMREEIPLDPFRNIKNAPESHRRKGILTPAEVSRLIAAPARDPRAGLAVLLGLLCGMRRGEVRGLLWGDIGERLFWQLYFLCNYSVVA